MVGKAIATPVSPRLSALATVICPAARPILRFELETGLVAYSRTMKFFKYHALGNDYLVIDPKDFSGSLTPEKIKLICHRHFGVGSDGILCGPLPLRKEAFVVGFFNLVVSERE